MVFKFEVLGEKDFENCEVFINNCEDSIAQQTIAWQKVIRDVSSDTFIYFVVRNNNQLVGAIPAFIKKGIYGNIMNSIPYMGGYGGIVTNIIDSSEKDEIYKYLLNGMLEYAKKIECILVTIVTSPFSDEIELYKKFFKPDYVHEKFMQYIDLQKKFKYKRDIKRQINIAIENEIKICDNPSDENIKRFYTIHVKKMTELRAKIFPASFFEKVKEFMVPKNKAKFLFAEFKGKMVSGVLFVFHNNVIDYFISNSDSDFKNLYANSLLVDYAINWAKENGFRYWNWQSSRSKGDGVYLYKSRWGGEDGIHYYLTKVLGDISPLKIAGLEAVREEYKWYFVLPYDIF